MFKTLCGFQFAVGKYIILSRCRVSLSRTSGVSIVLTVEMLPLVTPKSLRSIIMTLAAGKCVVCTSSYGSLPYALWEVG